MYRPCTGHAHRPCTQAMHTCHAHMPCTHAMRTCHAHMPCTHLHPCMSISPRYVLHVCHAQMDHADMHAWLLRACHAHMDRAAHVMHGWLLHACHAHGPCSPACMGQASTCPSAPPCMQCNHGMHGCYLHGCYLHGCYMHAMHTWTMQPCIHGTGQHLPLCPSMHDMHPCHAWAMPAPAPLPVHACHAIHPCHAWTMQPCMHGPCGMAAPPV
jgi:hypothetical protein